MTEPAKKVDMRKAMPRTASWVNEQREKHGAAYIDGCLRAAMAGSRNQFYAVEGGHVVGTPFDWTDRGLFIVSMSILTGGAYVAALRDPNGVVDMAIAEPATQGQANGAH